MTMRARAYELPELYSYFLEFREVEAVTSNLYRPNYLKSFNRIETVVSRVEKEFPVARGVAIGDFGCGPGMLSRPLAECGYRVLAIDTDRDCIDSLRKSRSGKKIECVVGNIEDLDYPEGFLDAALAVELVEHCAYPEVKVEKIFRFVKPGGILVVTTPNGSRLGARILLRLPSFKRVLRMDNREMLEARQFGTEEHVLRIKLNELKVLVPGDGEIIEQGYFGISGVLFNRLTYYPLRLLPLDRVISLTRALPHIPLIRTKVASKVYAVIRKRRT